MQLFQQLLYLHLQKNFVAKIAERQSVFVVRWSRNICKIKYDQNYVRLSFFWDPIFIFKNTFFAQTDTTVIFTQLGT
jgi:hypothetical protein